MLCQKCGLTEATIHRKTLVFRQEIEEHLCFLCGGGIDGGLEALMAEQPALHQLHQKLPWRLAGEFTDEEKEIQFNDEGVTLLRSLIASLVERADRAVSLSIHFGKLAGFAFASLTPRNPRAIRLMLFSLEPGPDARTRVDKFFQSAGNGGANEGQSAGWKCDLSRDTDTIASACTRLFSEVLGLTQDAVLKVKLSEYLEAPAPQAKGQ